MVLLAAGIGLTPFLGVLSALAEQPEAAPAVHLVVIARHGADMTFAGRLREAAARLPRLRITRILTRPRPEDRPGIDYDQAGRIPATALGLPDPSRRPLVYLCGPEAFLRETKDALTGLGLPAFDVFSESFAPAAAVPKDLAPRTVRLARTGHTFTWTPAAGTLLDAAEAASLTLPSGCRAGQCESCSLPVASGAVAHLGPYDGEPDHCLTCRAVPVSDLVLDA